MNIGDQIGYVPSSTYAMHPNQVNGPHGAVNDFPWVFGLLPEFSVKDGETKPKELTQQEAQQFITQLKRHPNPSEQRKRLVFLRPCVAWPAVVTLVNEDGTVNIDIQSNQGGFTLHERNVKIDSTKKTPHTCHLLEK